MYKQKKRGGSRGQSMIEGAVGLVIVVAGGIVVTALILDSALGVLFKSKLAIVASEAAQFSLATSASQAATVANVQQTMATLGLRANNLNVSVQKTTIAGGSGVLVSVSNSFPLFGSGNDIPSQWRLSDTEFAASNNPKD